jgi:hypothetical protein
LKNKYRIEGNDVFMELNDRKGNIIETVFDISDFEKIKEFNYKWFANWKETAHSYYVQSTVYLGTFDGKPKYKGTYLHKYIMESEGNMVVDHIDNNSLNNRRSNLRILDTKLNLVNRKGANKNSKTGIRNVTYSESENKYIVQIVLNGINQRVGKFDNIDDAEKCATKFRNKYYESKINNYGLG